MKTFYELLQRIKDAGVEQIQPLLDIGHSPTIGDMYEGLVRKILNKVVAPLNQIKVVSGKIKNSKGQYSDQLDCMVVDGVIKEIPNTGKYIVAPHNVIAVIEVKKNLFSAELIDAMDNLWSVVSVDLDCKNIEGVMSQKAFENITGRLENYSIEDIEKNYTFFPQLKNLLLWEEFYPLRIVFGFEGFSSEMSLRDKFVDLVEKNIHKPCVCIPGLPNLIVCGENSLIKANGMPFTMVPSNRAGDTFAFYASYKRYALKLFTELLLFRISYRYHLDIDLLNGFEIEAITPLLTASWEKYGEEYGWVINALESEKKHLEDRDDIVSPQKVYITEKQWIFLTILSANTTLSLSDSFFEGIEKESFLKPFLDHRVVAITDNQVTQINGTISSTDGREYYFIVL